MASLPPYSTFRTDSKQMMYPQAISHGNVLTFTPPGFKHTLNVKFPDSRLAVCEKCKKNYKTRDMCRVRNTHTGPPWTTAYICITLDESCTDENGKYVDKPLTVRMVQWQPFCVKQPFDNKTPVCSSCKKTNRTRSFCRDRHQHRQLPWCTVYVLLSALDKTDPSTVVAAPSQPLSGGDRQIGVKTTDEDKNADGEDADAATSNDETAESKPEDETLDEAAGPKPEDVLEPLGNTEEGQPVEAIETSTNNKKNAPPPQRPRRPDEGDNINAIEESRTFLARVSVKSSSILWVELAEYDPVAATNGLLSPETTVQALNAAIRNPSMSMPPLNPQQYYAQMAAMGYTPQQQHQAYQMQQQHFYNMQHNQQQHFAQQQSAWQTQYSQQAQPAGAPGATPQPSSEPTTGAGALGPSKSAAGTAAPTNGEEPEQPIPPTPITAGEAAAAKQKEQEQNGNGNGNPAPTSQAQAQAQWHAQMMYHQQLYQQQMQMQHAAQQGMPPEESATGPDPEDSVDPLSQGPTDADLDAVNLQVDDGDGEENNAKRQRIDVV